MALGSVELRQHHFQWWIALKYLARFFCEMANGVLNVGYDLAQNLRRGLPLHCPGRPDRSEFNGWAV